MVNGRIKIILRLQN